MESRKCGFAILIALVCSASVAQGTPTDQQLVQWAVTRCQELRQPVDSSQLQRIDRDPDGSSNSLLSRSYRVQLGEVLVSLGADGSLRSYADMSIDAASPSVGTEKYLSHAEVESALRQKLGYLLLERPLDLASAEWEPAGGGPPALVRFKFGELVHGYECEIGNEVMGTLHRVTGRILTLYVRSGWRYESPNIRVSPSRAVEIVRGVVGPAAEQWVHKATYYYASSKESAPAHVRNLLSSKMCRLVHVVGGSNGSAIVDSVTGDIWSLGMNESAHGSGNRTSNTGAVADVEPVVVSANPLDSPKPEEVEPEKLVGIVAGSLLASYLGIRFAVAKLKR